MRTTGVNDMTEWMLKIRLSKANFPRYQRNYLL